MKTTTLNIWLIACIFLLNACEKEDLSFESGDIEIEVETGKNWLHDYPLFLGITKKNPPQFAIWVEDTLGNYLSTVFVTYKIATEDWVNNNGNRRKEALPHWCFQRGIIYDDGLMLPTKKHPLTDGITGATPKENTTIQIQPKNLETPFVVKAEFNHSTDFNEAYPQSAKEGNNDYSGGEEGSGQPAVIYSATVLSTTKKTEFILIGHSSPDGNDGIVYGSTNGLTSAKSIVKNIRITVR
ncbi:hypothetical protein GM418_02190 [Maribellus comscasis]|uniref:Uncharacterized protein n=1 Tax=Maribellus comscasis TaxID=2681766 RepID=A0A6I6JR99_9BACT|nr:hypothetical protein [Maribellus comscasis]QGY42503.1 hypothetical protein GM418_02190 [Maribellus comscasis]